MAMRRAVAAAMTVMVASTWFAVTAADASDATSVQSRHTDTVRLASDQSGLTRALKAAAEPRLKSKSAPTPSFAPAAVAAARSVGPAARAAAPAVRAVAAKVGSAATKVWGAATKLARTGKVQFVAGGVAGGFVGQPGADAYNAVKSIGRKLFGHRK